MPCVLPFKPCWEWRHEDCWISGCQPGPRFNGIPYLWEIECREIEQDTQNPPLASTQLRMKNICTLTYICTYKTHTICLTIVTQCVYLYVFMHVCMSLSVYYVSTCFYVFVCACMCLCAYMCVCLYLCMCMYVGMCSISINKSMTHNDLGAEGAVLWQTG